MYANLIEKYSLGSNWNHKHDKSEVTGITNKINLEIGIICATTTRRLRSTYKHEISMQELIHKQYLAFLCINPAQMVWSVQRN